MRITVEACKCNQCGHIWLPRESNPNPTFCADCKSVFWDKAKRDKPKRK